MLVCSKSYVGLCLSDCSRNGTLLDFGIDDMISKLVMIPSWLSDEII